jgi:sensor domain CHASE-containing protein
VHTLVNRSATTVRFHDAHRPALDFEEYIEDLDRLTRAGKLTTRMTARTLVYGATVLVEHRPMQLTASPAQRAGESVLAALGTSSATASGDDQAPRRRAEPKEIDCHTIRCPVSSRQPPQAFAFPRLPSACGSAVGKSARATA